MAKLHLNVLDTVHPSKYFLEAVPKLTKIKQDLQRGLSSSDILEKNDNQVLFELLTTLRENVLNWYPFDPDASVLEIGGDGGAITGFLAARTHKVVSIEFFDILGKISWIRHQEADNIDIYVGNPLSFISNESFDYIILNEILPFAELLSETQKADEQLIHFCQHMLKPDGKLLIIAENRMGLQYFNGKTTYDSDRIFDRIEDVDSQDIHKGYSKKELTELISRCGFATCQWFYMLPDPKFVQVVLREDHFKPIAEHYRGFSGEKRISLFNENSVLSMLYSEGIAEHFVNAFLVEAGSFSAKPANIIFAKISAERNENLRIATCIEENSYGEKRVVKLPVNQNAVGHLKRMENYYAHYPTNGFFHNAPCRIEAGKDHLIFPYYTGKTLEEKLVKMLEDGQDAAFEKALCRFKDVLYEGSQEKIFTPSTDFVLVFGSLPLEEKLFCKDHVNLDMIFPNIFCEDENYYIIDYEWVFDFEIPMEYVLWRSIFYLYQGNLSVRNHFTMDELLEALNLSTDLQETFYSWEQHFGFYFVGGKTLQKYAERVENVREELQKKMKRMQYSSILSFCDTPDFQVCTYLNEPYTIKSTSFQVQFDLSHTEKQCFIRWCPISKSCKIKIETIQVLPETEIRFIPLNNIYEENGWHYFLTDDPEYEVFFAVGQSNSLKITGKIIVLDHTEVLNIANDKITEDANQLAANTNKIQEYQQLLSGKGLVKHLMDKAMMKTKKQLNPLRHGIKIHVDEICRFDEGVQIQGWALNLSQKEGVMLAVQNNVNNIHITRSERIDLNDYFGLKTGIESGFCIDLKGEAAKRKFLIIKAINQNGTTHYAPIILREKTAHLKKKSPDYSKWIHDNEPVQLTKDLLGKMKTWAYQPKISILMPVYNAEKIFLSQCIDSVLKQWYPNWELCIVDDCSTEKTIRPYLEKSAEKDGRIHCAFREKNGHISQATNDAAALATGEFLALLDDDDTLAPFALYRVVEKLNENPNLDLIYSDEDKITESGKRKSPFFKPDWSPDTLLSQNYICHFTVIRKTLFSQVGGFELGLEGAQDHDLFLKCTEMSNRIAHIPEILYHWRESLQSTAMNPKSKDYAYDAGCKAIQNALLRRNLQGNVQKGNVPGTYIVHYKVIGNPKVSIVIPTKDHAADLKLCIDTILCTSGYNNFEIIVVDNRSSAEDTFALLEQYQNQLGKKFRVLTMDIPFNFSKLNNEAAKIAEGEYLLLMNNDIEMVTKNWMPIMLGYAQQSHIGAVGAKLYYPDDTIQHAGIVLGIGGVAGHSHKYFNRKDAGYFCRLCIPSNYAGVTAALLMVERKKYFQVGGLNENDLKVAFNDVDFNIKLLKAGYYNVCLPQIEAYHYESKSRGVENTAEKKKRFNNEVNYMIRTWGRFLKNDPFYNVHLTLDKEDFSFKGFKSSINTALKKIHSILENIKK